MHWRIVNRTPQLLIVPLNSVKAVHLAPSETSLVLERAEINGNAKVDKLLASDSITLVQEEMPAPAPFVQPEARRRAPEPAEEEKHKSKREQEAEREPVREREHEPEPEREHRKK